MAVNFPTVTVADNKCLLPHFSGQIICDISCEMPSDIESKSKHSQGKVFNHVKLYPKFGVIVNTHQIKMSGCIIFKHFK